jgi:hypothetical protein
MRTLIASIIMAACTTVTAQQASTLDTFRQAYDKQQQLYLVQYGKTLDTILVSLKKKGDLDNVLILQSEQKRFEAEKTVPTPKDAKDLFRPASEAYYQAIITVQGQYVTALDGLIKKEVAADHIEEAKLVKAEKDKASALLTDLQTKLPAKTGGKVETKMPPVAKAGMAKTTSALPKETRSEEAILLIYCDDECQAVYQNGDKLLFQTGKEAEITVQDGDVLAIKAWDAQGGSAGGLIVGLKLKSTGKAIVTDSTWLYSSKEEDGWQESEFNDKKWKRATVENFEWLIKTINEAFAKWKKKPKPIWGKGGTVYFRKQIFLRDFN